MKTKIFCFFLPQFFPTPENDEYWGAGFTDWQSVNTAEKLFTGHRQPIGVGELGQYDLRDPGVLKRQAHLAKRFGVDGFAIYHYHFDVGKKTLHLPLENLHKDSSIDIEYFLCWVNSDWTKSWVGDDSTTIFEQKYSSDFLEEFFQNLKKYMLDSRYLKIDGRPVLYIHRPKEFDIDNFILIGEEVMRDVFPLGFFLVCPDVHANGEVMQKFERTVGYPPGDMDFQTGAASRFEKFFNFRSLVRRVLPSFLMARFNFLFRLFSVVDYSRYSRLYVNFVFRKMAKSPKYWPTTIPGWDNTPRYKRRGFVLNEATPEEFGKQFAKIYAMAVSGGCEVCLVKAWNEWAEGNYLEPDLMFGRACLQRIHDAKINNKG